MTLDTNKFKKKLETELALVEKELNEVGRKNPSNPKDWEAVGTELESDRADVNEVADEMENFADNTAILGKLEAQYNDIKLALKKIKDGTYGKCEVDGTDIPVERLEANPAARTCIEHGKIKK